MGNGMCCKQDLPPRKKRAMAETWKSNNSVGEDDTSASLRRMPDVDVIPEVNQIPEFRSASSVISDNLSVEQLPGLLSKTDISDLPTMELANFIPTKNSGNSLWPGNVKLFQDGARSANNVLDRKSTSHHELEGAYMPGSTPILTMGMSSFAQLNVNSPTRILPRLWLGTKMDSTNDGKLIRLGITHILSLCSGKQHEVPSCQLLSVPMADNGNSDLTYVIDQVFPFIEDSQRENNRLLIHCNLGQNRSPTLVIAWLMRNDRRFDTMFKAYKFVKSKRPMVQPHKSYVKQLRNLDHKINKIYSTPDNFLMMSVTNGHLDIAHEGWSDADSSKYIESQLNDMKTEDRAEYHSRQMSKDESTYDDSISLSSHIVPDLGDEHEEDDFNSTDGELEVISPDMDQLKNLKDGGPIEMFIN